MKPVSWQETPVSMTAAHSMPLVSVLIRTQGRASLGTAVESVFKQHCTDWELLIVNASGHDLPQLDSLQAGGTAAVRILNPGKNLSRSDAANALLDAATGCYGIFLDDDDWLLPEHLAKLVERLQSKETLIAAYSDVQSVTVSAEFVDSKHSLAPGHLYAHDFDPVALQIKNYLPIHAVLFKLDKIREKPACRFATELTLFEDWDFWIQLASRGLFERVPGVSGIYALSSVTGSGHAEVKNAERAEMLALFGERQIKRWQTSDVTALIAYEAGRTGELAAQQQLADMAKSQLDSAVQGREELRGYAEKLVQQRQELQQEQEQALKLHATERESLLAAIAQLQSEGSNLQQELLKVRAYSQLQQAEIQTLAQVRLQHLEQIAAIHQSRSWQITRPLRYAARVTRSLPERAPLRLARNAVRAVRQDIAQKGVVGFVRRLPYYLRHRHTYLTLLGRKAPAYEGSAFAASPAQLRNVRLHPDLTGGGTLIDAKVSVVIPTLNAGSEFGWMLRKLRAQRGVREIEIVVVDSGSKDATVQMARDADAMVVEILPSEFSHSYARNLGADHATGDYVLFTVQDAYPIGNYWVQGLLAYLQEHANGGLAAVSCAEYSRSDSDMMYDSMVHTHYTFLGCREYDRIGKFVGHDHMSLRSQGQLSDLSCLIGRDCFQQFRYQGSYAEDLDLGVRLIQSGKKVAIMASIKVIHSHNRPAYYYLKRSFVDVIFLVGLFDDFTYPQSASLAGLVVGIQATAVVVAGWLKDPQASEPFAQPQQISHTLDSQIDGWIANSRKTLSAPHLLMMQQTIGDHQTLAVGDDRLDTFVASLPAHYLENQSIAALAAGLSKEGRDEARQFADMFIARLEHFKRFVAPVYGGLDALLAYELKDAVRKTFAATVGSALAFYSLSHLNKGMAINGNTNKNADQDSDDQNADQRAARKLHLDLAKGV